MPSWLSPVERLAVNQSVKGPNPFDGATTNGKKRQFSSLIFFHFSFFRDPAEIVEQDWEASSWALSLHVLANPLHHVTFRAPKTKEWGEEQRQGKKFLNLFEGPTRLKGCKSQIKSLSTKNMA